MGENRGITPEKQLLKLIESGSDPASVKQAQRRHQARRFFSLGSLRGALAGRFSFFKRAAGQAAPAPRKFRLSFGAVNKALGVAVVLLFVYLVSTTIASAINLKQVPTFTPEKGKDVPYNPKNLSALQDENYYFEKARARDLFKEGPLTKEAAKKEEAAAVENEAAKTLSLVGISWSQSPDAIIEDKEAQKTYFVKNGQSVGDYVVKKIEKDKVILTYNGQSFELR